MESKVPPTTTLKTRSRKTVCPCCGFKFHGELRSGCHQCGVRSVGEPLSRPERELPFLGRALFVTVFGALMLLMLLVSTALVLIEKPPASFGFWNIVSGSEVAVWQLKFIAIPMSLIGFWLSRKIWSGIRTDRARFVGGWPVHAGFAAATISAFLYVALIGITVPARIHSYHLSVDAEQYAKAYAYDRMLLDYRSKFGTLPTVPGDLRKLPDPDGTIAEFLRDANQSTYRPSTELASASPQKMRRGQPNRPRVQPASLGSGSDVQEGETVSFTSYELRTPGADGVYGNEDDLVMRDGVVEKAGSTPDPTRAGGASRNRLP
jgi:hypothetical protein